MQNLQLKLHFDKLEECSISCDYLNAVACIPNHTQFLEGLLTTKARIVSLENVINGQVLSGGLMLIMDGNGGGSEAVLSITSPAAMRLNN